MNDDLQQLLRQGSQWVQEDPLGKLAVAVVTVLLVWVAGLFRRKGPEWTTITARCKPGEKLYIQVGEDDDSGTVEHYHYHSDQRQE